MYGAELVTEGRFCSVYAASGAVGHVRRDCYSVELRPPGDGFLPQNVVVCNRCNSGVAVFAVQTAAADQLIFVFHSFHKLKLISIPFLLFCSTGIISTGQMHPYLAFLFHRDYFGRLDSSPSCSFVPQGLFLADRMHLYLPLLYHRDYFGQPDASLSSSFSPQGLFPQARCIPFFLFCSIGIISPQSDTPPIAGDSKRADIGCVYHLHVFPP